MFKLKKVCVLSVLVMMFISIFSLAACGKEKKASIIVDNALVEIEMEQGASSATKTIYAMLENVSYKYLIVNENSEDFSVEISDEGNGKVAVEITAFKQFTKTLVSLSAKEASVNFYVEAFIPVNYITANADVEHYFDYSVKDGGSYKLDSSMFSVYPQDSILKDLNFYANSLEGEPLENDTLVLAKNLSGNSLQSTIPVYAVSKFDANVNCKILVEVVERINTESFAISVIGEDGKPVEIRNNKELSFDRKSNSGVFTATVVVPKAVVNKQLKVNPVFDLNSALALTETKTIENVNDFTYEFRFVPVIQSGDAKDTLFFEFGYYEYPNIKSVTSEDTVSLTVYDKMTSIKSFVDGREYVEGNKIDLYTSYENDSIHSENGLKLIFAVLPMTASENLVMSCENGRYLNIFDESGNLIKFTNANYVFNSNQIFYIKAVAGFDAGEIASVIVTGESSSNISQKVSFALQEGIEELKLYNSDNEMFYVENEERDVVDSKDNVVANANSTDVYFSISPKTVDGIKATITTKLGILDFDKIEKVDTSKIPFADSANANLYKLTITAKNGAIGTEFVTIKYSTGHSLSFSVVVFEAFSDENLEIIPAVDAANSNIVGDIDYSQKNDITSVALKYNQGLLLDFKTNATIENISYSFMEMKKTDKTDVYDKEDTYNLFNNFNKNGTFDEDVSVISKNSLNISSTIYGNYEGKVWVKVATSGYVLQYNETLKKLEYQITGIENYIFVEVYVPIYSIDVENDNCQLYAYDEVGEFNKELTKQNFKVVFNNGNIEPTYNKIFLNGEDFYNGCTYGENDGIVNYQITYNKSTGNHSIELFTRVGRNDTYLSSSTLTINSLDLNREGQEKYYTISFVFNIPTLVSGIDVLNVSNEGINLLANSLTENKDFFQILTRVSPSNAHNTKVVYVFEAGRNTLTDMVSIDENGKVTAESDLGGSGVIKIYPQDCVYFENGIQKIKDNAVCVKVNITVQDGASKETAIKISNIKDITNNKLHYMLTNDVVCNDDRNNDVFDKFEGGLYGSYDGVNNVTITTTITLFGTLTGTAVVENLIIVGVADGAGFVANENNGQIINVCVDSVDSVSKLTNTAVNTNVGGIVGSNNGLISNCLFAGSLSGTSYTGGLAGTNEISGKIENSSVLVYNMDTDFVFNGKTGCVGGLVGLVNGGKISNCYIYNYSAKDFDIDSALVAEIASSVSGIVVDECFANGINNKFFANKTYADSESKTFVKNSYLIYSNNGDLEFAYIAKNGSKTYTGTQTTANASLIDGINYGATQVWGYNSVLNNGFSYLNKTKSQTQLDVNDISVKNTRLSLAEENVSGISVATMFVYKAQNIVLTATEKTNLNIINTLYLTEMFGVIDTQSLVVVSGDSDIIKANASSLTMKNTGICCLTISSKFDRTITRTIYVNVVYYTSGLSLSYNGINVGTNSNINVFNNSNSVVSSSIANSIVLDDREIDVFVNEFAVDFGDFAYIENNQTIGKHYINAKKFFENETKESVVLSVSLKYKNPLDYDFTGFESGLDNGAINKALSTQIQNYTTISNLIFTKAYSPKNIMLSHESASIMPSDSVVLDIVVSTDEKLDDEKLNNYISFLVYDSENKIVNTTNASFDSVINVEIANQSVAGDVQLHFVATINVDTDLLGMLDNNGYSIVFYAGNLSFDISAQFDLKVVEERNVFVGVNNYIKTGTTENGTKFDYYPSNVLAPSDVSLLDVVVLPEYLNYTNVEITSSYVNGQKLSLQGYSQNIDGSYFVDNNYSVVADGIRFSANNTNKYYAKVLVPSTVLIDSVFVLTITLFNNDEVIHTQTYSILIVPFSAAGITINGNKTIYGSLGEIVNASVVFDKEYAFESVKAYNEIGEEIDLVIEKGEFSDYGLNYTAGNIAVTLPKIATDYDKVVLELTISRYLNGVLKYETSFVTILLVEFQLDFEKTTLDNQLQNNTLEINRYFKQELDFVFGNTSDYVETEEQNSVTGQGAFNEFSKNNSFESKKYDYSINRNKSLINCLYFVNGNSETPAYNNGTTDTSVIKLVEENGKVYIEGTDIGTTTLRLKIQTIMPDNNVIAHIYDFKIVVDQYTDEDCPDQITDAESFLKAADAEDTKDYILMNDIYLYDYTPLKNTNSFASLDGNGHKITIISFADQSELTTRNYSLFETISASTLIKNVTLNIYFIGEISVQNTSNLKIAINYAPFAINNEGIITNCRVVSVREVIGQPINNNNGIVLSAISTKNIIAKTAGFVLNNNNVITNSSVGGKIYNNYNVNNLNGEVSVNTEILDIFNIDVFGDVAGFVYDNNGSISSSIADNISILNEFDTDYTTTTAGFVCVNDGKIMMSSVVGVKNDLQDIHAEKAGIKTFGNSAAFVFENNKDIENSYANISLNNFNKPGKTSSGFVYVNNNGASISTSVSFSKIKNQQSTQKNFIGVNALGEYQNFGVIENCYYYDNSITFESDLVEDIYDISAKYVDLFTIKDMYYGFNFSSQQENNGIWRMTDQGPILEISYHLTESLRYGYYEESVGKFVYNYADGYGYGSEINPILIRNAEEYNYVFGGAAQSSSVGKYINYEENEVFGSYRIINNIDLSSLIVSEEKPVSVLTSSSKSLTKQGVGEAVVDGNGFAITNIALSDTTVNNDNFGLFAKIENGAMVKNLNLVVGTVNNENIYFGVEASNTNFVGALAGSVVDSQVINVSVSSTFKNQSGVAISGKNIAGGIVGRVIGDSRVYNLSATDISVTATYTPDSADIDYASIDEMNLYNYNFYSRINDDHNKQISYAGGILGVIDVYASNTILVEEVEHSFSTSTSQAIMLYTNGVNTITGGTVGGVAGFIGQHVSMQDACYTVAYLDDYSLQSLASYNGFAGGIAGYNRGFLRQVRSEHDNKNNVDFDGVQTTLQKHIEDNVKVYYDDATNKDNIERGNMQIFNNQTCNPIAVGGLVGLQNSGSIIKSYSKINVISNKDNSIAGGVTGYLINKNIIGKENTTPYFEEIYTFGDVFATNVGAFVGRTKLADINSEDTNSESGFKTDKINAMNFWGEDIETVQNINNYGVDYGVDNFNKFTLTNEVKEYSSSTNGQDYDNYFKGSDWDTDSWQRNNNDLLPSIVFGYYTKEVEIWNEQDIDLMRFNSESTNYVIKTIIDIKNNIAPILDFKGTLIGDSIDGSFGFNFQTNQKSALFHKCENATFNNFTISFENANFNVTSSIESVLVRDATGSTFKSLTFKGIDSKIATTTSFGLVTGKSSNCSYTDISIVDCATKITESVSNVKTGMLIGEGSVNLMNNINIDSSSEISSEQMLGGALIGGVAGSIINYIESATLNLKAVVNSSGVSNQNTVAIANINCNAEINLNEINNESYVGGLFGQMDGITISNGSDSNFSSKVIITKATSSFVGGFAGSAENCSIKGVVFNPSIQLTNNTSTDFGVVFGQISSTMLNNVIVEKGDVVVSAISANSVRTATNIGGLCGKATDSALLNCEIYSGNEMILTSENSGISTINIGGLVGYLEGNNDKKTDILNCVVSNTIALSSKDYDTIKFGGLFGYATNANISSNLINSNLYHKFDDVKVSGVNAYFGGVSAESNNSEYNNNIVTTNVYPNAEFGCDENKASKKTLNVTKDFVNHIGNNAVYFNGVSYTTNTNDFTSNYIFATFVNYNDKFIAKTYSNNVVSNIGTKSSAENKFSHVYTLNIETGVTAENIEYKNINKEILKTDTNFIDLEINDESIIASGTKLNPLTSYENIDNFEEKNNKDKTYYFIDKETANLELGLNLCNTVMMSNGASFDFDNESVSNTEFKNTDSIAPFNEIDNGSYVAGFVSKVDDLNLNITNGNGGAVVDESNNFAGMVGTNKGIVFSCNVVSNSSYYKTGNVYSEINMGGFAFNNSGYIADCYSALNMFYDGSGVEKMGGFVAYNTSTISNCYSSGTINAELSKSIYIFGEGQNVKNCYSNIKVYNSANNNYAFDKNIIDENNNFYDAWAAEFLISGSMGSQLITDNMSMEFGSTANKDYLINKTPFGHFNQNIENAFGYGSFSDGAYKEIEYMHHYTGNGIEYNSVKNEKNSPYQIPNLGKLNKMISDSHYIIINDLDGSFIRNGAGFTWGLENISDINLSSINCKIENIKTSSSALFDRATNCVFSDITINNIIINKTTSDTNKNEYSSQFVAVANGCEFNNIAVSVVDLSEMSFDKNLTYGFIVGQMVGGALRNCTITKPLDEVEEKPINLVLNVGSISETETSIYNITIGCLVGTAQGAAIIEEVTNLKNINVQLSNSASGTITDFIFGAIVGKIDNTAQIKTANTNSTLDVLTEGSGKVKVETLYVGGVVGMVEATAKTSGEPMISNEGAQSSEPTYNLKNCGVYGNDNTITAGNYVDIGTTYLGGISGFGGSISNSYLNIAALRGYSQLNVDTSDLAQGWERTGNPLVEELDNNYYPSRPNVYENNMDSLDTIVYKTINQKSYVAGIANEYEAMDKVANFCEDISGGMYAKTLYAMYDVDKSSFVSGFNLWNWINDFLLNFSIIPDSYVNINRYSAIFGEADEIYIPHNALFPNLSSDSNECDININVKNLSYCDRDSIFDFILNRENSKQEVYQHLYQENGTITKQYVLGDFGLQDGIYNSDHDHLQVYDVYTDGIGLNQGTTGEYYNKYCMYEESTYSYKQYQQVGISSSDSSYIDYVYDYETGLDFKEKYYYIDYPVKPYENDKGETVYESLADYNVAFKVLDTAFDNLTAINANEDILKDWGWMETSGGSYAPSTSPEVSRTDLNNFVEQNIDVDNTTIIIKNQDDYRAATIFVNEIQKYDCSTDTTGIDDFIKYYTGEENYDIGENTIIIEKTYTMIQNGGYTIKFIGSSIGIGGFNELKRAGSSYIPSVNTESITCSAQLSPFGTEKYSFNGKIVGESLSGLFTINDLQIASSNDYIGMVGIAKYVEISNIKLLNTTINSNSKNSGLFVGKVLEKATAEVQSTEISNAFNSENEVIVNTVRPVAKFNNVTLSNCNLNVELKNTTDTDNVYNAGALIGYAKNATVEVGDFTTFNTTIKTVLEDAKGDTSVNAHNVMAGGMFGTIENTHLIVGEINDEKTEKGTESVVNLSCEAVFINLKINVGGANTAYVGGIAGQIKSNSNKIAIKNLTFSGGEITATTDIVSATDTASSYAGGIAGSVSGALTSLSIDNTNVLFKKIDANTNVKFATCYAGGVFGYADSGISGEITSTQIGVEEYDNSNFIKLLITAGVNGDVYAKTAHTNEWANNIVISTDTESNFNGYLTDAQTSFVENNVDVDKTYKQLSYDLILNTKEVDGEIQEYYTGTFDNNDLKFVGSKVIASKTYDSSTDDNGAKTTGAFIQYELWEFEKQYLNNLTYRETYILNIVQSSKIQLGGEYAYKNNESLYIITIDYKIDKFGDFELVRDYNLQELAELSYLSNSKILKINKCFDYASRGENLIPAYSYTSKITERNIYKLEEVNENATSLNNLFSASSSIVINIVDDALNIGSIFYDFENGQIANGYSEWILGYSEKYETTTDSLYYAENGMEFKIENENLSLEDYGNYIEISIFKGPVMYVDVTQNKQYQNFIISVLAKQDGVYYYTDYVYVVKNNKLNSLGYIEYQTESKIGDVARNNMFYPEGTIKNYKSFITKEVGVADLMIKQTHLFANYFINNNDSLDFEIYRVLDTYTITPTYSNGSFEFNISKTSGNKNIIEENSFADKEILNSYEEMVKIEKYNIATINGKDVVNAIQILVDGIAKYKLAVTNTQTDTGILYELYENNGSVWSKLNYKTEISVSEDNIFVYYDNKNTSVEFNGTLFTMIGKYTYNVDNNQVTFTQDVNKYVYEIVGGKLILFSYTTQRTVGNLTATETFDVISGEIKLYISDKILTNTTTLTSGMINDFYSIATQSINNFNLFTISYGAEMLNYFKFDNSLIKVNDSETVENCTYIVGNDNKLYINNLDQNINIKEDEVFVEKTLVGDIKYLSITKSDDKEICLYKGNVFATPKTNAKDYVTPYKEDGVNLTYSYTTCSIGTEYYVEVKLEDVTIKVIELEYLVIESDNIRIIPYFDDTVIAIDNKAYSLYQNKTYNCEGTTFFGNDGVVYGIQNIKTLDRPQGLIPYVYQEIILFPTFDETNDNNEFYKISYTDVDSEEKFCQMIFRTENQNGETIYKQYSTGSSSARIDLNYCVISQIGSGYTLYSSQNLILIDNNLYSTKTGLLVATNVKSVSSISTFNAENISNKVEIKHTNGDEDATNDVVCNLFGFSYEDIDRSIRYYAFGICENSVVAFSLTNLDKNENADIETELGSIAISKRQNVSITIDGIDCVCTQYVVTYNGNKYIIKTTDYKEVV